MSKVNKQRNHRFGQVLAGAGLAIALTFSGCSQASAADQTGAMLSALESEVTALQTRLDELSSQSVSQHHFDTAVADLQQKTAKLQQTNEQLSTENLVLKRNAKREAVAQEEKKLALGSLLKVNLTDIAGKYGEKEIDQVVQLGIMGPNEGEFNPNGGVTRAEFVRWLVTANNRFAELGLGYREPIRLAEHSSASFSDVSPDHPDFRYIQGMVDAGFVIGYDETTFAPNRPLSREELVAIKSAVDWNQQLTSDELMNNQKGWSDSDKISKKYYGAFANDRYLAYPNIPRTFGSLRAFKPQQGANRAEVAKCLSALSAHGNATTGPRHVTAEEALVAAAQQG